MNDAPLVVEHLWVEYANGARAVRDLSLRVEAGSCLALVGESGCGKTSVVRAALGLLPEGTRVRGSIRVDGHEVIGAPERLLRRLRGTRVGYVAQDPFAACNPLLWVSANVAEAWHTHGLRPPAGRVGQLLAALGIDRPSERGRSWPHQWSGGMLQRAGIAAATAHTPPLVLADEPTSALDADRGHAILAALRSTGAAVLLVSHDLGLVAAHADTVAVCYAGRIVEIGPAAQLVDAPRHPYTRGLLAALPRPGAGLPVPIPGTPPAATSDLPGCAFAPRCALAADSCWHVVPELVGNVACPRVS